MYFQVPYMYISAINVCLHQMHHFPSEYYDKCTIEIFTVIPKKHCKRAALHKIGLNYKFNALLNLCLMFLVEKNILCKNGPPTLQGNVDSLSHHAHLNLIK